MVLNLFHEWNNENDLEVDQEQRHENVYLENVQSYDTCACMYNDCTYG